MSNQEVNISKELIEQEERIKELSKKNKKKITITKEIY